MGWTARSTIHCESAWAEALASNLVNNSSNLCTKELRLPNACCLKPRLGDLMNL